MTKDDNNQIGSTSTHLDQILREISDRRSISATSGASLIEKAKDDLKVLDNNDIEKRVQSVEDRVMSDLIISTVDEAAALYE